MKLALAEVMELSPCWFRLTLPGSLVIQVTDHATSRFLLTTNWETQKCIFPVDWATKHQEIWQENSGLLVPLLAALYEHPQKMGFRSSSLNCYLVPRARWQLMDMTVIMDTST